MVTGMDNALKHRKTQGEKVSPACFRPNSDPTHSDSTEVADNH